MSPFLGPARYTLCPRSSAAALLQWYYGARARDRVDFYERKRVTWGRAELHSLRTLALRISILSALLITSYSAVQRAQAQEAVGTMTRNAPHAEAAPPDLVNSAEAPSFQATQAPTDSSIVDLT